MVKNSFTLLKRLFIGGILTVGLMPGIAQAKWIKVSLTGVGVSPANPVQLDFVLYNYTTTTANSWNQEDPAYGYGYGPVPLYGFGTGVSNSSPQTLQGPFDAHYQPGTGGNTFALANDGTGLFIDLTGPTSIPHLVKGFGDGAGTATVKNIQISGALSGFSTTSTSLNVVDFLSSALSPSGSKTFSCASNCASGIINFSGAGAENVFNFTWTSAQFDEIESVPTPLPIFGALSAFSFSRKLRKRINIQKFETFS